MGRQEVTPKRTVQILERFSSRILADTSMSMRDLECLMYLVETETFDHNDLREDYGIDIFKYSPAG